MIYAHLNNTSPRTIIGYECGNRKGFDQRHGGDPNWMFLDYDVVTTRINQQAFFSNCQQFYIDEEGLVQQHYVAPLKIIPNYVYVTDPDGAVLTDIDGAYFIEPA